MLGPGSQFGRYEIQRKLGRGGMGTVYVAHDPVLGRMVAIKLFLSDMDLLDASERFTREARSAAALNHSNIVTIYDFGEYDSRPYIAMEYVQGETIAEIIKRKAPTALVDKLRWMEELCAGVAYAHRIGVIHRDIKPMNLMVDRTGRLKILDFGIAKMIGAFATNTTSLVGSPGYMAPEQILGGAIDNRSDLFSIGVVCYELLAYSQAFPGENTHAITHRILSLDPVPLHDLIPGINPELAACVELALKKSPNDRFDDAERMRVALARVRRQVENETVDSAPTVLSPRPAAPPVRPPTGTAKEPVVQDAAVGQLTPPPDLPGTAREGLSRRRAAQIEAALERSRAALARGDLDVAEDECLQALTLDDRHVVALELEASIKLRIAKQKAATLLDEAREALGKGALTGAQGMLQQARSLDPDVNVKRLERDLRLARVEQESIRQRAEAISRALDAAEQALVRGDVESALAFARQALELSPESERGRTIEAEATRRLEDETSAVLTPDAADTVLSSLPQAARTVEEPGPAVIPATVITPEAKPAAAPEAKPAAAAAVAPAPASAARSKKQKPKVTVMVAAAVLAAVVVAGIVMLRPPGAAVTGAVLIDAIPFATVTGIEGEDGSRPAVPPDASTPLELTLPVGTYRVRLVGPPPGNESRVVTVRVQADGVAAPVEQFPGLTPEQYFEPYLSAPVAAPEKAEAR